MQAEPVLGSVTERLMVWESRGGMMFGDKVVEADCARGCPQRLHWFKDRDHPEGGRWAHEMSGSAGCDALGGDHDYDEENGLRELEA